MVANCGLFQNWFNVLTKIFFLYFVQLKISILNAGTRPIGKMKQPFYKCFEDPHDTVSSERYSSLWEKLLIIRFQKENGNRSQ